MCNNIIHKKKKINTNKNLKYPNFLIPKHQTDYTYSEATKLLLRSKYILVNVAAGMSNFLQASCKNLPGTDKKIETCFKKVFS